MMQNTPFKINPIPAKNMQMYKYKMRKQFIMKEHPRLMNCLCVFAVYTTALYLAP